MDTLTTRDKIVLITAAVITIPSFICGEVFSYRLLVDLAIGVLLLTGIYMTVTDREK